MTCLMQRGLATIRGLYTMHGRGIKMLCYDRMENAS